MNKRITLLALSALAFGCVLAMSTPAGATTTITLGEQNFPNGVLVSPGDYVAAQGDDTNPPVGDPFDTAYGSDDGFGPSFDKSWTFAYVPVPVGDITSASVEIGIWDHDSNAELPADAGTFQVDSFDVDTTNDMTTPLNSAFEASGGHVGYIPPAVGPFPGTPGSEYNTYTIPIAPSAFADLADGTATFHLVLTSGQGGFPTADGGSPTGYSGAFLTTFNGAGLDFSTLTINTGVIGIIPEPSTVVVWSLLATFGLAWRGSRRRKQR